MMNRMTQKKSYASAVRDSYYKTIQKRKVGSHDSAFGDYDSNNCNYSQHFPPLTAPKQIWEVDTDNNNNVLINDEN